jgi:hypothetical protein
MKRMLIIMQKIHLVKGDINMLNLEEGKEYSKSELEHIFGINFGFQINGIVVRKIDKRSEKRLILLFQRSNGPYPDLITEETIKYIGAGLHGDQSLSRVNKVLAERGPIDGIYFFHQSERAKKWKYLGYGLAQFLGEEYSANGRKLMVFNIKLHR